MSEPFDFDTRAVRAGTERSHFNEHSEALFLTSSFVFESAAQAAARFSGAEPGYVYSRFTNPTVTMFERRLASLEGAEDCLATSSGMTLGSADPVAERLNVDGRARWGRVSRERVLSGDGLAWLHALAPGAGTANAAQVAQAAASGDARALETVRLFSRLLGEFAGDVCLAFQATAGVYLCGGVLHGLQSTFDAEGFLMAFAAKGRFTEQLRRVPVHFAAGHELGLQGAARFLAGQCCMPSMQWSA